MRKRLITVMLGACLAFCLLVTSCAEGYGTQVSGSQSRQDTESKDQETAYATSTPLAATFALTRDALRNAEYTAGFPAYGTLQRDRIGTQDPLAFGDLNGDGIEDAAVVLLLVDGNAGHRYLAAVLNENGVPRHVASVFLGLNIGIDSVTITDRVVTLQTKQLGPNDPTCCPTKEVVATFRLTDNAWHLIAETPAGQVAANFHAHVDAALIAEALRIVHSSEGGGFLATDFLEAGGTVTFDDAPFQNLPDVSDIPFDIVLDVQENHIYVGTAHRRENAETLAALLTGTLVTSLQFRLGGDPDSEDACYQEIQAAYHARAALWQEFFGSSGKPSPNLQEAFLNQNLQRLLSGALPHWVRGILYFRQFCGQFGAPSTPTPTPIALHPTPTPAPTLTPTPTPAPGGFDLARVEHVFRFLDIFAKRVLAEIHEVNPGGSVAGMLVAAYARNIDALPTVYIIHLWAVGGPESDHALAGIDAFGQAYFREPRHYLQLADTWLTNYLADPCSVSEDARSWVIEVEERSPGTLRANIRAAVTPQEIVQYVLPTIYEQAEEALYENPNLYRCVG